MELSERQIVAVIRKSFIFPILYGSKINIGGLWSKMVNFESETKSFTKRANVCIINWQGYELVVQK